MLRLGKLAESSSLSAVCIVYDGAEPEVSLLMPCPKKLPISCSAHKWRLLFRSVAISKSYVKSMAFLSFMV
jgi:hypothetical protein